MPVGSLTSLLVSFTPGVPRSDFDGDVGMMFSLTAGMTFNRLGVRYEEGDVSFLVTLRNADTLDMIAEATVDLSAGTIGNYYYTAVPQFILTPGVTYALMARVVAFDGQSFADVGDCAIQNQATVGSAYGAAGGPPTFAVSGSAYVGLDLDFVAPVGGVVDLAGNLGSPSAYGKLAYGRAHYGRGGPFAPIFAGNFDIVGQDYFFGDLAPIVTFAGVLGFDILEAGDLAPQVTFAATLSLDYALDGDLAPQVALGASLAVDLAFEAALDGAFAFTVVYMASSMISGPLWAASTPCSPSMWTPIDPCDPVEWEDSELCNG